LAGDVAAAERLLRAVRAACAGLRLKVILETGELRDEASILRAARLALAAAPTSSRPAPARRRSAPRRRPRRCCCRPSPKTHGRRRVWA
jgi:hypothetical protein